MTIKDASEKYGVSSQAIYQRLKRNKIPVESLKDKETGDLTPDALGIIENLFGQSSEQFNQRKTTMTEELNRLKSLVQTLEHEKEILQLRLDSSERERARIEETLNQERAMFNRFLPPAKDEKKSLFKRLFG